MAGPSQEARTGLMTPEVLLMRCTSCRSRGMHVSAVFRVPWRKQRQWEIRGREGDMDLFGVRGKGTSWMDGDGSGMLTLMMGIQ
jgi:hypothetical protein